MKEYKIQYKEVNENNGAWWDVGDSRYFYSLEDAKREIEVQKSYDKDFTKNTDWEYWEYWEYRILVREVHEWKELQEL